MNCEQMTALLSAYVDGELTAQEELQVRNHLAQCPQCRALYEQLQTLHTSFSDLEEIPAPEHFAQGVMSRIRAEEKPKVIPLFKRPQFRAVMGMAACAVVCIGIGSVAMNGGRKSAGSAMAPQAPAAVPEAAFYSETQYEAKVTAESEEGMAPRMDEAPAEVPAPEASAPTAPVEAYDSSNTMGELVLEKLPEGLEDAIGPLEWEERMEDGALCALLTPNQGEKVMELAYKQNISVSIGEPAGGEPEAWQLVLLP